MFFSGKTNVTGEACACLTKQRTNVKVSFATGSCAMKCTVTNSDSKKNGVQQQQTKY